MSYSTTWSWTLGLLLCASLATTPVGWAAAAEEQDAASEAADANEDEPSADEEESDPFAVPEGGAKEMAAFIIKLAQTQFKGETELEKAQWLSRASRAMADAAARGLDAEPTEQEAQMLTSFRLMALQRLQAAAKQELEIAAAEARNDERAGVASAGWRAFVQEAASQWDSKTDEEKARFRQTLLDDFPQDADRVKARVSAVRMAAMFIERTDAEYAKQLAKDAISKLEASENKELTDAAEELAGMLRRMDLMGNAMELQGPLLDGEELNWESYRGKIVLVDFWATWCGPCVAELPNVKEMYVAYHDKGFDVLGISLDTSKEKVEKFVEDREIEWKTMFAADEEAQGWNHPMARYYGVSAIPTAILVDRDGRVVHMNARGPALKEKLQELLGDPAPKEEGSQEEATGDGEEAPTADESAGQ
jgi:peroxiredoxin